MGGVGGSQPPTKARRERARKRFTLALQKYAQNACKARPLTRGLRGGTSSPHTPHAQNSLRFRSLVLRFFQNLCYHYAETTDSPDTHRKQQFKIQL